MADVTVGFFDDGVRVAIHETVQGNTSIIAVQTLTSQDAARTWLIAQGIPITRPRILGGPNELTPGYYVYNPIPEQYYRVDESTNALEPMDSQHFPKAPVPWDGF
jgi:hypothetical protein